MCVIFSNAPALREGMMIARGSLLMGFQIMLAFFAWLTAPSLCRARLSGGKGCPLPPAHQPWRWPPVVSLHPSGWYPAWEHWGQRSNWPWEIRQIPLRNSRKLSSSLRSREPESAWRHEQAWCLTRHCNPAPRALSDATHSGFGLCDVMCASLSYMWQGY